MSNEIAPDPQATFTYRTEGTRRLFIISDAAKANDPRWVEVERQVQEIYDSVPFDGYIGEVVGPDQNRPPGFYTALKLTDRELAIGLAFGMVFYAAGQDSSAGRLGAVFPTDIRGVDLRAPEDKQ